MSEPWLGTLPAPELRVDATYGRTAWVDVAKGVGIVLVVIGHVIDGLQHARLIDQGGMPAAASYLIYTFHMPLFFMLSGLFVESRLAKSPAVFVGTVLTRVAWPYVLWSVIQLTVISTLGALVNHPAPFSAERYLALAWLPVSQFWFLHALVLMLLVSYMVVPRWGSTALFALALFLQPLPELIEAGIAFRQLCWFFPFYALGVVLGRDLGALKLTDRQAVSIGGPVAIVWLACSQAAYASGAAYWSAAAIPSAIAGSCACIAFTLAPRLGNSTLLAMLGRHSLSIFLLHVLFIAGARIVLHKVFGISQPALIFVVATLAGIAGPLIAYMLLDRYRLSRLFGLR